MHTIDPKNSELLLIDFQTRLMSAISDAAVCIENARRLLVAAELLGLRRTITEQYPQGLGHTVPELAGSGSNTFEKVTFDGMKTDAIAARLEGGADLIVAGCEAHVCVLQTVLGARHQGRKVFVVADAIGSRSEDNRQAAISRMRAQGVEIVTTEMVLFEWLVSSDHQNFKTVSALIRSAPSSSC
ncbi:isochorismatase family protein [Roseobacter litoralis]|jgi:nicotinamidase-related amidase|uniref:isochorismatase family protein n=1 Tax=Roseobacter litoralis TaxID=42443 RepID=UPI002494099B|nr:isochorismatase family protein [Roseobacter litoralis]